MSEWVSVKDRMPPEETDVLVFCQKDPMIGYTVAGFFYGAWKSFETEDDTWGVVTHWMPLPDPPK